MDSFFKTRKIKIIGTILFFLHTIGYGQIPNKGFENWSISHGVLNPTFWESLNLLTNQANNPTCFQGTPGYQGASYLSLLTVLDSNLGIIPGIAISGKIDTITYKALSGFPFSSRPHSLDYQMQYMPADPSDSSSLSILLTKWDSTFLKRDTIAFGISFFNAMAHIWFLNSTTLNYFSGLNPDSALITIRASGSTNPTPGSFIYIDELQFVDSVIGIQKIKDESYKWVVPCPANDFLYIKSNLLAGAQIFTVQGNLILTSVERRINIEHLPQGVYFIKLFSENKVSMNKFVIQRW